MPAFSALLCAVNLFAQPGAAAQPPVSPTTDAEKSLLEIPTPASLRSWHDFIASEPHIAGTPGDWRTIDSLEGAFREMGLEVNRHEFWALLSRPVTAEVEVVAPERIALPVKETPTPGDPATAHPDQWPGFAAYSGSGEATGEVVYANQGRKEDFEKLAELGIDCTGKVVICRYGGNYRGFKAKFAQAAGAAALLVYTDPGDSGYMHGIEYPEGTFAGPEHIQRGSYLTLPYPGDPLTPGREAAEDADRLSMRLVEAQLPRIPVQPIGYAAATQVMGRMKGPAVPQGWQGGLPFAYRLTGGPDLRVRVKVEQNREITKSANVVATLRGSAEPDRWIIIGAHHDAWNCGAADPTSGTICMVEAARAFAAEARAGRPPRRTLVFCAWGAEEWGIIGSTEWVEGPGAAAREKGVAYINLDMATTGPDFGASATPSLKALIAEAARVVPQARQPERSVYDAWLSRSRDADFPAEPAIGDLGGGSDHIGFCCHLGIPSAALSAGGAKGTSYHGIADTLTWYRKTVGDDYEPALMVTRMTLAVASRLANAPLIPTDPTRVTSDFRRHLASISARGVKIGAPLTMLPGSPVAAEFAPLDGASRAAQAVLARRLSEVRARAEAGTLAGAELDAANDWLLRLERHWTGSGAPGRDWFRSLFVATDETSGYDSWMLPALRHIVENHGEYAWPGGAPGALPGGGGSPPGRTVQSVEDEYLRVLRALIDETPGIR
ncbi:MAG: M20/M25/M40 family metallo-hydrolase [Phycisphaerales bacterium]|nr:M20/M25/M40 family metallo-hydrolase [Phycisphaerales bacterium]